MVVGAAALVAAGALFGILGRDEAATPNRGSRPPQEAIDQGRAQLVKPDPNDPDSIGGLLKPDAPGLALVQLDPRTAEVVREPDGRPKMHRNPDGSLKLFRPEDIPPDQRPRG